MNEKCKKIKCPSVEDPQCVRMRRHDIGRTAHIIAANKCELEYMKCHEGVEAKIVPMKNCGHYAALTAGKKKNATGKAHIRVKRKASKHHASAKKKDDKEKSSNGKADRRLKGHNAKSSSNLTKLRNAKLAKLWKNKNRTELSKFDVPKSNKLREKSVKKNLRPNPTNLSKLRNAKLAKLWKNKNWTELSKFDVPKSNKLREKSVKKNARQDIISDYSRELDFFIYKKKWPFFDPSNGIILYQAPLGKKTKDSTDSAKFSQFDENGSGSKYSPIPIPLGEKHKGSESDESDSNTSFLALTLESREFPLFSNEFVKSTEIAEADLGDYDEVCPTACPSRDVMVCAKCQHGAYRTFLSVCHMRMFSCNHEDEFLQLISRYPCMLSAPYISAEWAQPKGWLSFAEDDDQILRFIACREQGLLGEDGEQEDPRCYFPETKEKLKTYDYKNAQINLEKHYLLKQSGTNEADY